ncbi:hypothetical protein Ciccas_011933 [Cichlidogyrus casuarinus]|uniref:Uncharacterized protein n=1 Tax=Cichlidogyrus casuarinus TaxID=1844966 RepID=A0ABD2PQP9_9PLAT
MEFGLFDAFLYSNAALGQITKPPDMFMSSAFEGVCETTLKYNIPLAFFFHFPIIYFFTKIGFLSRRSILTSYSRVFGNFFLCFGYAALISEIICFDTTLYINQIASAHIMRYLRNPTYFLTEKNTVEASIIVMAILLAVMLLFSHMRRHQQRLFIIYTFLGLIVSMIWGMVFVSINQWNVKKVNTGDFFEAGGPEHFRYWILQLYFCTIGPSSSAIWIYIGSKLPRDCSEWRIIGFIILTLVEYFVEVQIGCRFRTTLLIDFYQDGRPSCENALNPEVTNSKANSAALVMGIYLIHTLIRKLCSLFLIFENALYELGVNKRRSGLFLFTLLFILMQLYISYRTNKSIFMSNQIAGSIGYLFPAITMLIKGPISSLNAIIPAHQSCMLYKATKYLFILCIILTSFGVFSIFMLLILLLARANSLSVFVHFAKLALMLVASLTLATRHKYNISRQ